MKCFGQHKLPLLTEIRLYYNNDLFQKTSFINEDPVETYKLDNLIPYTNYTMTLRQKMVDVENISWSQVKSQDFTTKAASKN